jgi:hypothetical protein
MADKWILAGHQHQGWSELLPWCDHFSLENSPSDFALAIYGKLCNKETMNLNLDQFFAENLNLRR